MKKSKVALITGITGQDGAYLTEFSAAAYRDYLAEAEEPSDPAKL